MEGRRAVSVFLASLFVLSTLVAIAPARAPATSLPETAAVPVSTASITPPGPAFDNKTTVTRQGLAVPMGSYGSFDELQAGYPSVLLDGGTYKMWYYGCTPSYYCQVGYATSPDGKAWTKYGPVLSPSGSLETTEVIMPTVVKVGTSYWMWYNGYDGTINRIFAANSTDGITWTKRGAVLGPGPSGANDSFEPLYPRVLYVGGTFFLYYIGLTSLSYPDNARAMLATSTNGLNWTRVGTVLTWGPAGSYDSGNIMTASVALVGSAYQMIYWGVDDYGVGRLLYAQSGDGRSWQKLGLALGPGATEAQVGQPDFVPLANGTFFLYYGVRNGYSDGAIYLAWGSEDRWPPTTRAFLYGTRGAYGWYLSPVLVNLTATDNQSAVRSIQYRLNGGAWANYSLAFYVGEGTTTVEFYATDAVGNVEAVQTLTLAVDSMAPTVTVDAPSGTLTHSAVTITWAGSDAGSGLDHYAVKVDDGAFREFGTNTSLTVVLADGGHRITVTAYDQAGNVGSASVTVGVDTNVFSPSGPYLGIPLYTLLALPFVVFMAFAWLAFRRPRQPAPPTPPSP